MRVSRYALGIALPMLMWQAVGFAQTLRMSYSETKKTIERVKDQSEKFKDNFDDDVHRTGLDSKSRQDMKRVVNRFEKASENLKKHYSKDNAAVPSVQDVLAQGALIDSFISRHVVSPRVQNEWLLLRQDLDLLANSYDLPPNQPAALARTEPPAAVVIAPVQPQPGAERMGDLIRDIQTDATAFQTNVRAALAGSSVDDVEANSSINQYIGDFMVSCDRLNTSYSSGYSSVDSVNEVVSRAERIDEYMKDHPLSLSVQESWIRLRNDLVRLAAIYNLMPGWLSR